MGNDQGPQRWENRLLSLEKEVAKLEERCSLETENEIYRDAINKTFEFSFELAWKTLNDNLKYEGIDAAAGPRSTLQEALSIGLITDALNWKDTLFISYKLKSLNGVRL